MSQHLSANTSRLFSTSGTNYEADIVASSRGVLLDLKSKNYDTHGFPHRGAALMNLTVAEARRLSRLLMEAVAVAAEASPAPAGIWSNATTADVARRFA